jgi:hypothetical protein
MAFSTLAQLRARLNETLKTDDGADKPWGDIDARNSAIRYGFEQLEPTMQRFLQENVTVVDDAYEYDLVGGIRRVELIEQLTSAGATARDIKNYRAWVVDTDPPVCRLRFATPLSLQSSLVVSGYAPYTSDLTDDADLCDIEQRLEWIPLLGATAELYRRRFHEWLDFEQYNASNPSTTIDPAVLYRAYDDALRRFEQAKLDHMRKVSIPRRAALKRD